MYNIIVVDDEETIRNGISTYIKCTSPDFNIISEFDDGKRAIDFLKDHDVDIVITDIRMSVASGIDLAQYIYNTKPYIKVIFLSGYKEFEYAKQAMDFNVRYYLSKPIDLAELDQALNNLKIIIKDENEKKELSEQHLKRYENLYSLAKIDFFTDILFGSLTSIPQMEEKAAAIGIPNEYLMNTCCIFVIRLSDYSKWLYSKDNFSTSIFNLLRDIHRINEYILILKNDYALTLVAVSSDFITVSDMKDNLNDGFKYLKETVRSLFNIDIEFTIEFIANDVFSLKEYNKLNYRETNDMQLLEDKYKKLVSTIISKKYDEATDILNTMKQYTNTMDVESVKKFFANLFTTIFKKLSDRIPLASDIADYKQLNELTDKYGIFQWCDNILCTLFEYINTKSISIELSTIQKAKDYISKNYMNDITLDDIANSVYLNPVYFSRFFKLHTGVNLTDYLIEIRMNEAISLFKTHKYKVYEISDMCGYRSSKYFAKTFKQYTSYTPTEYSRILINGSEN